MLVVVVLRQQKLTVPLDRAIAQVKRLNQPKTYAHII